MTHPYTIPNLLTLLRIVLIPAVVVLFYLPYGWADMAAGLMFALAGITDTFDGYLARTGSSLSVNNSHKAVTSESGMVQQLASAVILEPGTYRVGIRNTSTTSNTVFEIQVAEAGMGAILAGTHGGTFQKTVYASSAWTDTSTSICAISPILTKIEDGKPWAAYAAGLG